MCLVYLDDIIVFSNTEFDHFRHFDEVIHLLYRAGLSLMFTKCNFFKDTVGYLGHVTRPGKLEVAVINTEALRYALPTANQMELRSVLGMCNVYRRFVPGFTKISASLNTLLKKGKAQTLGSSLPIKSERSTRFESSCYIHQCWYYLKTMDGTFWIPMRRPRRSDAACCRNTLTEKTPDRVWSRSLKPSERNYSTKERECFEMVWAILQLRPYLEGKKFLIRTDHHSLRWILNLSDEQGRLAGWRLRILEFYFGV
jgi:hypothetical protein